MDSVIALISLNYRDYLQELTQGEMNKQYN